MSVAVTVTATGETLDDLACSLEVVAGQLREGFTSGHDRNGDTKDAYTFDVTGEEEE